MRYLYVGLVLSLSLPFFMHAADVVIMEEIAAKVNGDIITSQDIADDKKGIEDLLKEKGLRGAEYDEALKLAADEILMNRIDDILLRQRGVDLKIKVDSELNKQIADYQRQFQKADPDAFQKFVVEQTGRSYEDFKTTLSDRIMVQRVLGEEVYRKIPISTEEERAYYNEHKNQFQRMERVFLRELLVSTQGKTTPEELTAAENKAKDLAARAQKGETFPAMVQNNSDNELTKQRAGLLDPFTKEQLAPAIFAEVWDKPAGYVTNPMRFDNGWEIFKVESHQREGLAEFEEVQSEVQNILFEQRVEPAKRAYLTKLRQDAFLQVKDGYSDLGAAPGKDTRWGDVASLKPETVERDAVLANPSMKKLLGMFPIPGTEKTGASSSR